jgi:hypothetical protein
MKSFFKFVTNVLTHVRWVPCHHGMARPQVVDGGDALQFWRAAANILNKQSWTADKGWSSSLRVGLTTHRKNKLVTNIQKRQTWMDSLDKRPT